MCIVIFLTVWDIISVWLIVIVSILRTLENDTTIMRKVDRSFDIVHWKWNKQLGVANVRKNITFTLAYNSCYKYELDNEDIDTNNPSFKTSAFGFN